MKPLSFRQRLFLGGVRWFAKYFGWLVGGLFRFWVGHDNIAEFMTAIVSLMPDPQTTLQNAARVGAVRQMQDLQGRLAQLNAQVRPSSQWHFHQDRWGDHEVVVLLPRVTDSNTGVVVGPPDNEARGSVVTNDGLPPNCDPAALNQILYGPCPPPGTVVQMPEPQDERGPAA